MSEKSRQVSAFSFQLRKWITRQSRGCVIALAFGAAVSTASAATGSGQAQLRDWAEAAVSPDAAISAPAIRSLRDAGPDGLHALLDVHAEALSAHRGAPIPVEQGEPAAHWLRLTGALDAVGRAKDTHAAGLYWYTDWDQAREAARASGKPILSLRLLGNLDEEYSCANSRFFRTALYANAEVSRYLRDHYILHWKSVRQVPRVSIDFGDGRRLERTLTGNSIHYVLDADGRIIDALPGLYGPGAFLRELKTAAQSAEAVAHTDAAQRAVILRRLHEQRSVALSRTWSSDLDRIGVATAAPAVPVLAPGQPEAARASRLAQMKSRSEQRLVNTVVPAVRGDPAPPADRAMMRAMSKMLVEAPLVRGAIPNAKALEEATDESAWSRMAALHRNDARLDESSLRLMREKSPVLRREAIANFSESSCPSLMPERFMEMMALDTVRNEYLYRREIHEWLAVEGYAPSLDELNSRVYAELFLTPDSDPWLGLLPADVYTALANDGFVGLPAR